MLAAEEKGVDIVLGVEAGNWKQASRLITGQPWNYDPLSTPPISVAWSEIGYEPSILRPLIPTLIACADLEYPYTPREDIVFHLRLPSYTLSYPSPFKPHHYSTP